MQYQSMASIPYFKNIKEKIISELSAAHVSIWVAMAWLTDKDIFRILCDKANSGIDIKLILLHDEININSTINYGDLVNAGGQFIWAKKNESKKNNILHNKFCIIDSRTVITGTYNWTYNAIGNDEDINIHKANDILLKEYISYFNDLLAKKLGANRIEGSSIEETIEKYNNNADSLDTQDFIVNENDKSKPVIWSDYTEDVPEVLISKELNDEDFIIFEEDGMFGYKDSSGNVLVETKYNELRKFKKGYAIFKRNYGYGIMDNWGNEVIKGYYKSIRHCKNGIFIMEDMGHSYYFCSTFDFDYFGSKRFFLKAKIHGPYGAISNFENSFAFISNTKYDYDDVEVCKGEDNEKRYWGCIDVFGHEIIPAKYTSLKQKGRIFEFSCRCGFLKEEKRVYIKNNGEILFGYSHNDFNSNKGNISNGIEYIHYYINENGELIG